MTESQVVFLFIILLVTGLVLMVIGLVKNFNVLIVISIMMIITSIIVYAIGTNHFDGQLKKKCYMSGGKIITYQEINVDAKFQINGTSSTKYCLKDGLKLKEEDL